MKKFNKIFLSAIIIITTLFTYSCDPFDDIYLTLAMDIDLIVENGNLSDVVIDETVCLSSFDDYETNQKNIEEIQYISSIYFTLSATDSLAADSLRLTLYQADRSTILFQHFQPRFVANDYKNKPLELILTEQEKNSINNYLKNPQIDKCFYATFELKNIEYNSPSQFYFLNSKMQFLTQLKVKP